MSQEVATHIRCEVSYLDLLPPAGPAALRSWDANHVVGSLDLSVIGVPMSLHQQSPAVTFRKFCSSGVELNWGVIDANNVHVLQISC